MTRSSKHGLISTRKSKRRQLGRNENSNKIMKSKMTNTERPGYFLEEIIRSVNEQKASRAKRKRHKKRMYNCCVPLCFSYGPKENFVPFPPSDSQERQAWINKIPRRNWLICHNTVICRNHFTQNSTYTVVDDRTVTECIPCLFPDVPIHHILENKYKKIDPCMLEPSPIYTLPETFGDLEGVPNFEDFIFEFFTLKSNYKIKVEEEIKTCHWLTQETFQYVLFYQLDVLNFSPSISISILINEHMKVIVSLEGIVMDPLDYTRHVPINGKITHWKQLRNILCDFGWERRKREEVQETLFVPQKLSEESTINVLQPVVTSPI